MKNINFNKYLEEHSSGYVIKIMKPDFNIETLVIGNRQILPSTLPMTEDCLFDIASLTKIFTAILIYQAIEENLINLNNTISSIEPKLSNLDSVTILDLLSHRVECWTNGYLGDAKTKEEFYNVLYTAYVKNKRRLYVDTHYIILSTILEKIYNKSYIELVLEKIAKPLKLKNVKFICEETDIVASNNFEVIADKITEDIHAGLIHDPKGRLAQKLGIGLGHAGIFITADDMMKILMSLVDDKELLLKNSTIEKMFQYDNIETEILNQVKNNIGNIYKTYNYCGTRYPNPISELNDVPKKASSNSIIFSGYTGPIFMIDFDRKIIILIMANVCHNSKLNRYERYDISKSLVNELYNHMIMPKSIKK